MCFILNTRETGGRETGRLGDRSSGDCNTSQSADVLESLNQSEPGRPDHGPMRAGLADNLLVYQSTIEPLIYSELFLPSLSPLTFGPGS